LSIFVAALIGIFGAVFILVTIRFLECWFAPIARWSRFSEQIIGGDLSGPRVRARVE